MIQRYIWVGICLIFGVVSVCMAGPIDPKGVAKAVRKGITPVKTPAALSEQLQRRVVESYQKAVDMQAHYQGVRPIYFGPSKTFESDGWLPAQEALAALPQKEVYPHAPFLKMEHTTDYFLIRHNLEVSKWVPKVQENQRTILARMEDFRAAQVPVSHPMKEDMAWLAQRIPQDTSYLLIGQKHGYIDIEKNVARLVREIRLRNPNRPILLLTEFLPEGRVWGNSIFTDFSLHRCVWEEAALQDISVIGLEPKFVDDNEVVLRSHLQLGQRTVEDADTVWASLEGVRLRNERWMHTIEKMRQVSPEALIIIYAGNGHLSYAEPYSLGKFLSKQGGFVVSLEPNAGYFDEVTEMAFPARVLQFNQKDLSELAGFDVQIRILVSAE